MQCSSVAGEPAATLRLGCRVPWRLAFYFWETRDPRLEPFVRALADFFEAVVKEGPLVAGYTLDGEPYGDHCEVAFMAPVQGLLKVNIFLGM